jgi:peptidoglycan/LPS O-acetylase OafA/YrhL
VRLRRRRDFEQQFPTDGISRPIGDLKRFPAFDGLRAFAAVSVVGVYAAYASGFNTRSSFAIYSSRLEIGVSVFFVISGFLLYRRFALANLEGRDAPSAYKFWVRRIFRIVPAYWLALTVVVYVWHDTVLPGGFTGALIHYSFLQIYFPSAIFYGITQAWSLCTEMSFYLFLPLYAMAIGRGRRGGSAQMRRELVGLLALTLISFAYRSWVFSRHWPCGSSCYSHPAFSSVMVNWLPGYFDLFAIGMLLALVSAWHAAYGSEPAWLRHRAMPWASWGLAAIVYWTVSHLGIPSVPIYLVTPETNILKQTLYGLFALLLVAPAVFGPQGEGAIRRLLRLAPVAWLGVVSYGIYLWHQALIEQFFKWTGRSEFGVPFGVLFLSVVVLSTIVASISYLGMEQPLLEFANHLTRRRPAASNVADATTAVAVDSHADLESHAPPDRVSPLASVTAALGRKWRRWRGSFGVRWFLPGLLAIAVLAIGVRVGFAAGWTFARALAGDAIFYHQTAADLASGHGYVTASFIPPHHLMPTAQHPPVFPAFLALLDLLGFHSVDAQRVVMGVVASAGVFLTGLVAHRVAGPTVGLVAAAIAAVHPLWVQSSAALMSESVYLVVIPMVLLLALGCLDHPSRWRFVGLGGSLALAILTRSDALVLVVFLGAPTVLFATRSGRERLALARCLLAGLALVLAPWLIRNEVQMGGLSLSDNQGGTLAGSYCPAATNPHSYDYGAFNPVCADGSIGFVVLQVHPPNHARTWTELDVSNTVTSSTESYVRGHLSMLPRLVLARFENTWGLARTNQQIYLAAFEGRVPSFERFGIELGRVLLAFELIGAIVLARRSLSRFFVLLAPLLAVTLNSAVFYGSTRILAAAEPSLAVFAALGMCALVAWVVRRVPRKPTEHEGAPSDEALALVGADLSESPMGAPVAGS